MRYTLTLLTNDEASALSRVLGVLRRRHLMVDSLVVTHDAKLGLNTLSCVVTHEDTISPAAIVAPLRKLIDVRDVSVTPGDRMPMHSFTHPRAASSDVALPQADGVA